LDRNQKLLYQYGDFVEFTAGNLAEDPLIKLASQTPTLKGNHLTSRGAALIATSQIMHTDESGPRIGTYLYGILLNKAKLLELKRLTEMDFSIIIKNNISASTVADANPKRLKDLPGIYMELTNNQNLKQKVYRWNDRDAFVYSKLTDVAGHDIALMELVRSRQTIMLFRKFFIRFMWGVYFLTIILVVITVFLIAGYILGPVTNLRRTLQEIQQSKDISKRVLVDREDEIGTLAKDFNNMMDGLAKAQGALSVSEEKYRILFESSADGIVFVDMSGKIMDANPAYLNMLGYTIEEIKKSSYLEITPARWHQMEAEIVRNQILTRGYSGIYEKEYIRKDGTVFPIAIRTWLVKDKQREVNLGMWAIVRDISERKKTELELKQAYDNLVQTQAQVVDLEKKSVATELAMGAVHQINNPLTISIGRVQLLRRLISYKAKVPEAELEKDLKIIEEQSRRAVDITNSLLRYAKPQALRFQKCNINQLAKEVIELVAEQLAASQVEVKENFKTGLPPLQYCDTQQLQDVFINIITNAQEAMPTGGILEISTNYNEREDTVCIGFRDTGCGIPAGNLNKLFFPFFSSKADKNGLGLPISYNIVKGHRGTIEVESQEGIGTTFTVKLPRQI
jgi:PAS domain S-box-containing protein